MLGYANPTMRSMDTNPEAERVPIALRSRASVAQRVALAQGLTAAVLQLAHRALWQAYPMDTPDEHMARFVSQVYGSQLGEAFRCELARRRRGAQP